MRKGIVTKHCHTNDSQPCEPWERIVDYAYEREEVLGPAISVAVLREDRNSHSPSNEHDGTLDGMNDILDSLQVLGGQLHR